MTDLKDIAEFYGTTPDGFGELFLSSNDEQRLLFLENARRGIRVNEMRKALGDLREHLDTRRIDTNAALAASSENLSRAMSAIDAHLARGRNVFNGR